MAAGLFKTFASEALTGFDNSTLVKHENFLANYQHLNFWANNKV